jgi:CubicO group peptidase (beta-lactamase class C family)
MCGTTRDLARLGRLFATGGGSEGRQVISRGWLDDIVSNGDPLAWKNGDFFDLFDGADIHYRSKWYVLREPNPLVFGFGVFGQGIFVDPDRDVVIAKNSSQPVPLDPEFMSMTMKGIHALRSILVK